MVCYESVVSLNPDREGLNPLSFVTDMETAEKLTDNPSRQHYETGHESFRGVTQLLSLIHNSRRRKPLQSSCIKAFDKMYCINPAVS